MFRLIWTLSVRTRDYLHRYMPSNRLLAAIRTRRGLKWGTVSYTHLTLPTNREV